MQEFEQGPMRHGWLESKNELLQGKAERPQRMRGRRLERRNSLCAGAANAQTSGPLHGGTSEQRGKGTNAPEQAEG
eukprot:6173600-Pleurochrysis_carterae.AAC.2